MNLLHRWQHYFSNLSVRRKLNLLTLLIALGVIALSVIAARMQYLDLTETRKTALKTQVELSYGILQHYHRLAGTGELSEDAAKSAALQALEVMRADNDTYYFNIYDTGYRLLMHPFRKDLVGKDMKDFRTDDGVRIYYDQVEAAKAGGGFVNYRWAKPGSKGEVEKVAYAGLFAPWNWVVSSGVYMDDVQRQALVFTAIMAISGGVLVLIVLALSWVIGNRIARPLKQATAVAEGIANGKLDSHIGPQPHDEPGRLLEAMSGMQQQLHAVIGGQREMARRHDAGELSYRIDASAFPGEYGLMVQETNTLVGSHVQTLHDVLDVVQQYAVGDLSRDIARYPGEKAAMTTTVDTVKANLGRINAEIKQLASAAAAGDFSQRGDAQRFDHDFRLMLENLNAMMAVSDDNLGKLAVAVGHRRRRPDRTHARRLSGRVRTHARRRQHHRYAADPDRWPDPGQCLQHHPRRWRDRVRQQRPVAPYRAAGRQPGRDRRLDGGTDLHRAPERRARPPGQPARHRRARCRFAGRRGGRPGSPPCRPSKPRRRRSPRSSASSTASRSRPTSWR